MKRSEGEVKALKGGQTMEEREVKRPSLDINPFLVEPILRRLLKKVDTVAQLKDLRKMCVLWDTVNIEELEERAFKVKLKVIDFQWTNRFKSKEEAKKELIQFLEDTRSIPQLFRFFKFNIPESLKVLQDHLTFFSDYPISRLELITPTEIEFKEIQVALNYFLSLIRSNLKGIQMLGSIYGQPIFEPKSPKWPEPKQGSVILDKLEELAIEHCRWGHLINEFFKSALAGSEGGHITSLKLILFPGIGVNIGSFPGLDPTRMTCLDIRNIDECRSDFALKFSSGLMTLVEKGMRLMEFGVVISSYRGHDETPASLAQNLPSICSNMTHFFATQSSTLTSLHLTLQFFVIWSHPEDEIESQVAQYGKIQLPVFSELHTLFFLHSLKIKIENPNESQPLAFSLFKTTQSPPLHFPSLINLSTTSEFSMSILCDSLEWIMSGARARYHLKLLELPNIHFYQLEDWNIQRAVLIGSVEHFRVPANLIGRVRIPWKNSIRKLTILAYDEEMTGPPLKLSHLKKLETLVIKDYRKIGYEKIDSIDSDSDDSESESSEGQENISDYLSWFSEATKLNLTSIKFIGLKMVEDGIKERFINYFPFPILFETGED